MSHKRYFLCPECGKKMTCDIFDKNGKLKVLLKCQNGLCGAESWLEFSSSTDINGKPIDPAKIYPFVASHLRDLRKKIRHPDYNDRELYPIDGQISIDDVCKEF